MGQTCLKMGHPRKTSLCKMAAFENGLRMQMKMSLAQMLFGPFQNGQKDEPNEALRFLVFSTIQYLIIQSRMALFLEIQSSVFQS